VNEKRCWKTSSLPTSIDVSQIPDGRKTRWEAEFMVPAKFLDNPSPVIWTCQRSVSSTKARPALS
jgi:hypothetical protein